MDIFKNFKIEKIQVESFNVEVKLEKNFKNLVRKKC